MNLRIPYAVTVAAGSFLAVLAAFFPWASVTVPLLGSITRYGYEGDGIITLMLAVLAAAFAGYLWLQPGAAFRLITLFTTFLGVLIFAIGLVNLVDSERAMGAAERKLGIDVQGLLGVDLQRLVDTGEGVYITLAAGALIAVASALAHAADRFSLPWARSGRASEVGSPPCPRCQTAPPDGASYCPACGHHLG